MSNIVTYILLFYITNLLIQNKNLPIQTKTFINNNIYMQHIIGFVTLFVLITLIDGNIDTSTALIYTLIGYIWYIFSTKMDIHWNIIIIIMLFIGYMIENNNKIRKKEIITDTMLTNEQQQILLNNINRYDKILLIFIICITFIGTLFYNHKKQIQYGQYYDNIVYFFGKK